MEQNKLTMEELGELKTIMDITDETECGKQYVIFSEKVCKKRGLDPTITSFNIYSGNIKQV